jgi:signal transduction histidine kinase/DNA-binding response OmpR family regulator/HPt (histidine-containing phosphotransfer) domain-containing protein
MAERRSPANAGSNDPRSASSGPPEADGRGPDARDDAGPGDVLKDLGRTFAGLLGRPHAARADAAAAPAAPAAPAVAADAAALRRRVVELEAELEQARALAQGKAELLATMTHELRTPMNGMMGMAHLLLETELDGEQRGMLEVLLHAGEGLLDLVNDTLDFSRAEAGKLELERLPFDLRVTANEVGALLAPMANEKGLHLECVVRHEVPSRLVGDPGRLRQVLLNLGGNAVKFTERGRVTLAVERLEEGDASVTLRFSVADTGIGMDEETRGRIFRAFEQADASVARRFGGTGLGLTISSRLVALMGGQVGVESAPGEGSIFRFDVTLAKQPGAAPAEEAAPADPSLAGVRVLVVEPSAAMRRSYVSKLCARGCRVESAGDAETALPLLRAAAGDGDPFRFALIERELPGMNGEDLGAGIRAESELDRTLTVLVNSAGNRGDAARARARGFAAYVSKPLDWDQLAGLLVEVRHRAETAPAGGVPELVTLHSMAEARRSRLRILLVEDSAVNQLVTQWTLQRLGYGLQLAATAAAALAAWEREPFDLVLLDLRLPDGDGCALARELRSRETPGRRVPLVAMTGSSGDGERERCLAAGMDEFLVKPVDLGLLCDVVERLTRGATGSAADAAPAARDAEAGDGAPAAERLEVVADDAPLLHEIEAAEADICGLARPGAAPGHAAVRSPGAAAPADALAADLRAAAAEAEADRAGGALPEVGTLSSADVVPLPDTTAPDGDGPRPALDLERLEQSSMGVPALRDALLGAFLAEVRPRLEQLGQAVVARDARRVEFEAHGLKGMCLTLGADVCGEVFAEMERLGREQRLDATGPLLKRAYLEVTRTERYIATLERRAA